MTFEDHFSSASDNYAKFRPTYPNDLFQFILSQTSGREHAWDCATGNGQAALKLSPHFRKITATDGSKEQIEQSAKVENIEYRVALAEQSGIPDKSVDLTTVAQALHWFDFPRFYEEVNRVSKRGAAIAVWGYGLLETDSTAINSLIMDFYHNIVHKYWPPQRSYVDEKYHNIPFPFEEVITPEFQYNTSMTLSSLVYYLQTWSAVKNYKKFNGVDPTLSLRRKVEKVARVDSDIIAKYPIFLRLGKV